MNLYIAGAALGATTTAAVTAMWILGSGGDFQGSGSGAASRNSQIYDMQVPPYMARVDYQGGSSALVPISIAFRVTSKQAGETFCRDLGRVRELARLQLRVQHHTIVGDLEGLDRLGRLRHHVQGVDAAGRNQLIVVHLIIYGRSRQPAELCEDLLAKEEEEADADLRGALDNDQSSTNKDKPNAKDGEDKADPAAKPQKRVDYQLARALDLLRGLALYRNRMVN